MTGADEDTVVVGDLSQVEQAHRVDDGDHLNLTRTLEPAAPTASGSEHRIGCTLPEVFHQAKPGERVWLDDGKIGGVIVGVAPDEIELRVTDVCPGGVNLKAGKGINFPDTDLRLDARTGKDLDDLDFVARHADMVNLSFVRQPTDVERLQAELDCHNGADVGIVLKIENVAAFEQLPDLLLIAMRSREVGVMIARPATSPSRSASNASPKSRRRSCGPARRPTSPSSGPPKSSTPSPEPGNRRVSRSPMPPCPNAPSA
jgi:pyruvate kinase